MGRSRAIFLLPPGSREQALSVTAAFGREKGLKVEQWVANYVQLSKGNENLTGKRSIRVQAHDLPQGVQITVDAWLEDMTESNADPRRGGGKRKKLWALTDELCRRLGSPDPSSIFQHM